jgi:hypothetical protein
MTTRIVALFLCAITLVAQKRIVPLDESDKEGELEIRFITALGDPVHGEPDVTVEKLVNGRRVADWKGDRIMKLKYGTYRLRIQYSGAYPVDKNVKIQKAFQAVFICFFVAPIELPWDGNLIRGQISEKSRMNDCRWVRFVSPFADSEFAETKATESGHFVLENVRPGKYSAFTVGKGGICETSEVTILGAPVYDVSIPAVESRKE